LKEVILNRFRFILGAVLLVGCLTAGVASAQTPAKVVAWSGNGQAICSSCTTLFNVPFFQPMTALVTDANNVPIPNYPVSWAITAGGMGASLNFGDTTNTDANGMAVNVLLPSFFLSGTAFASYYQTTVTATAGNAAAAFVMTQALPNPAVTNPPQPITIADVSQFLSQRPDLGPALPLGLGLNISGKVGTTGTTPIKVFVGDANGFGIPNVALNLYNLQPSSTGPFVQCGPDPVNGPTSLDNAINGTVLTQATGIATCYPQFLGKPNVQGQFDAIIGAVFSTAGDPLAVPLSLGLGWQNMSVSVTPGAPGSFTLVSGNSQSAQAGQAVANPLAVQVLSSGTPASGLAGQTVTWSVSPAGAATLGNTSTTTDGSGKSTNTVTFSSTANGAVKVTATLAGSTLAPVVFTLNAIPNVTITDLQIVSGNNQAAIVGAAFPTPLKVQLTASGGVPSGIPVTFSVSPSGAATLSSSTATTDSTGTAQVTATAGNTAGPVTVTATSSGKSVTFNLTISPPGPSLTATSFVNGADLQRGALSPCGIGAVIASGVAPGVQNTIIPSSLIGPLPTTLNGTQVLVNSLAAPIAGLGIGPTGQQQVTFQVPCETPVGSNVPFTVNVGAGTSSITAAVQAAAPGVFTTLLSDNNLHAVLIRPNGDFATLQNPARRGENVTAFVTGVGPASPAVATGALPPPGVSVIPQYQVVVGLAGHGVPLVSAVLSSDRVGVWAITFQIPADATTGNSVPFSISVIPTGASAPISSGTTGIPIQ
jgi:uncharacterized protein (TIGR03437 family)